MPKIVIQPSIESSLPGIFCQLLFAQCILQIAFIGYQNCRNRLAIVQNQFWIQVLFPSECLFWGKLAGSNFHWKNSLRSMFHSVCNHRPKIMGIYKWNSIRGKTIQLLRHVNLDNKLESCSQNVLGLKIFKISNQNPHFYFK